MDVPVSQDGTNQAGLIHAYLKARRELEELGYGPEIEWQESRTLDELCPSQFLAEFAWVVLCAGMRESIIRQRFPAFSLAFFQWKSADEIVVKSAQCRSTALHVFNHPAKVDAILTTVKWLSENGVGRVKAGLSGIGAGFLRQFPFMGPVTSLHLAKNLGLSVAKPDRHLKRIAQVVKQESATSLCETIATLTAHPIAVVDLVLWRYATINHGYVDDFREAMLSSAKRSRKLELRPRW